MIPKAAEGNLARVDRRGTDRKSLRYLRVYSPAPGSIVDMSSSGMCLETVVGMNEGQTYSFRLRHRSLLFSLRGRVLWSRVQSIADAPNSGMMELHRSGVCFDDPLPDEVFEFLFAQLPRLPKLASKQ